jgi:hypothetical protein
MVRDQRRCFVLLQETKGVRCLSKAIELHMPDSIDLRGPYRTDCRMLPMSKRPLSERSTWFSIKSANRELTFYWSAWSAPTSSRPNPKRSVFDGCFRSRSKSNLCDRMCCASQWVLRNCRCYHRKYVVLVVDCLCFWFGSVRFGSVRFGSVVWCSCSLATCCNV